MFRTLFKKELMEQARTFRLLIILVVLFVVGLISPLTAKYLPEIMRSVSDMPAGIETLLPAPSIASSLEQYVKNLTQFGVLLMILFNMGAIAQEKDRGTAAMVLVKPVSRSTFVLAKWLAAMATLIAGLAAAAAAMAVYTAILFGPMKWGGFLALNLLMGLFLGVYATVSITASALARTQGIAAAYAFGGLAVLLVAGSLPWITRYMPGSLINWGTALTLGVDFGPAWWAVVVSVGIIAALLTAACLYLERTEI